MGNKFSKKKKQYTHNTHFYEKAAKDVKLESTKRLIVNTQKRNSKKKTYNRYSILYIRDSDLLGQKIKAHFSYKKYIKNSPIEYSVKV